MIKDNYRISELSKDLGHKTSKKIIDLLAEKGLEGKAHSAILTVEQIEYLLEYFSKGAQIKNLNDYIDGKTKIAVKKTVKPTPPPPPPIEEKAAPTPVQAPPKTTVSTAAPKGGVTPTPSKFGAPVPPVKPTQPSKDAPKIDRFQNPLLRKQESAKPTVPQQPRQERRANTLERKVATDEPAVRILDDGSVKGHVSGTKVVDTRAVQTDLSRYDERHEKSVDIGVRDEGGKQKLKKQVTSDQSKKTGKDAPKGRDAAKGGRDQTPPKNLRRDVRHDTRDQNNVSDGRSGRGKQNNAQIRPQAPIKPVQLEIEVGAEITVGELASRMKTTAGAVVKQLILLGTMATVNQSIDYDTAEYIAGELGVKIKHEVVVSIEDKLFDDAQDDKTALVHRAPVVVVMGHVDHGKTSLLDAIRQAHVAQGEAGGITQHIGAYRTSIKGQDITFLDTPGHAAFTAMRARGAMATDIAILVVAADDGIMPQTVEAINHAKAAKIDIIVAINKMDKPGADPERIKQELTKYELVSEDWGGETICVPVSAVTKSGIDALLEAVLLVAEVKELRANPDRRAKGIVIESKLDKGRGPVATVLVQNGTLKPGDVVIAGSAVGRIRAMTDENRRALKTAGPSVPVEIVGLAEVPSAGDEFAAVEDERMARELAEQRKGAAKTAVLTANTRASLDTLFDQIKEGAKELAVIVKADVDGSAEAVKSSLQKLNADPELKDKEVKIRVIHSAVGGITEGDVMLAAASNAVIVGFNVRPDKAALDSGERNGVEIRTYRIIYECLDEIKAAMLGMLAPEFKEAVLGHAQVRQTFKFNGSTIAGAYVQDGKISRNASIRVIRDGKVISEDKISSLKRFKDDVREVATNFECGIGLDRFNDIKEGDILEAYETVEVKR